MVNLCILIFYPLGKVLAGIYLYYCIFVYLYTSMYLRVYVYKLFIHYLLTLI